MGNCHVAHQVEGNTNNNWYQWEQEVDNYNQPRIHNGEKSGLAADHWNRYPEDIKLMNELGVNTTGFPLNGQKLSQN